ncbi:tail assembly chaperone [Bacillus phage Chotacabras]|nr:tail assembly chaperone [Bacillus phage Chotacabras]
MTNIQKDIEHLQEAKTPEQVEAEKQHEQREVIDRIIRGKNDIFTKHYDLPEFDLNFTISIKAPNAIEVGKIQARTASYLSGMNTYMSQYYLIVYQTLASIRVCGKQTPKFLENDEDIYNLDILYAIGVDFSDWMNTFADKVKHFGGLKQLARTPYMRNLWALMREFKVLPPDESFRELSDIQIDLMLYSMAEDAREMERARKGVQGDGDHYDSSFDEEVWNRDVGDWEVLKDGHDGTKIAQQINDMTKAEDLKNLEGRFDGLDEYNEHLENGGMTSRESEVTQYINKQLEKAEELARERSRGGKGKRLVDDRELAGEAPPSDYALNKKSMDDAIALFEGEDDEYTTL